MRIDGWHADGFGILKDFDQADLEPGVTVLLGENEAGKSTLLAFVRAMLFGFPDGRSKERSYPPLLGGRHGGKLLLRDRNQGLWVVERYADQSIGLADASIVILAARYQTRTVVTLDRRHFGVVRPIDGGSFKILP